MDELTEDIGRQKALFYRNSAAKISAVHAQAAAMTAANDDPIVDEVITRILMDASRTGGEKNVRAEIIAHAMADAKAEIRVQVGNTSYVLHHEDLQDVAANILPAQHNLLGRPGILQAVKTVLAVSPTSFISLAAGDYSNSFQVAGGYIPRLRVTMDFNIGPQQTSVVLGYNNVERVVVGQIKDGPPNEIKNPGPFTVWGTIRNGFVPNEYGLKIRIPSLDDFKEYLTRVQDHLAPKAKQSPVSAQSSFSVQPELPGLFLG